MFSFCRVQALHQAQLLLPSLLLSAAVSSRLWVQLLHQLLSRAAPKRQGSRQEQLQLHTPQQQQQQGITYPAVFACTTAAAAASLMMSSSTAGAAHCFMQPNAGNQRGS
jgi:hypothetical protein